MEWSPRFRHLSWASAALALFGVAQAGFHHLGTEENRWERPPSVLSVYGRVAEALPTTARVGYLSTGERSELRETEAFVNAAYALAPRSLVRGTVGVDRVVAVFAERGALDRLCAAHGLAPVLVDGTVALLARAPER